MQDLDAAVADLKAKGVTFTMEPREARPGLRICFIEGPQNITIELLERRPA
ncbi:VOC family protein [Roseicella aquatilis]|uniref:VOC family protein n=1 Tax=Roseicella aquatilis TaxID=2527868 RepID=UPI001F0E9314|nr:VOC family protein [Roseicella aquatilis]